MLETPRLILRPATLQDASDVLKLHSDLEILRYTGDRPANNLKEVEDLIKEKLIPQFEKYKMGRFLVFLKDGTCIGWCGLKPFPRHNEIDLGYRFLKEYWGKGYATEAAYCILNYGFQTLKLKKIIAKVMPENMASIKVLQKLNMNFRGLINDPSNPYLFVIYDLKAEEFK